MKSRGGGGLIGAGRSEVSKGVCRPECSVTGETHLNGAPVAPKDYRACIQAGVVYLSEDRKGDGVLFDMAKSADVSALDLRQVASAAGILHASSENNQAR